MNYQTSYSSPIGDIIITSDGTYLTGLYFKSSKLLNKIDINKYVESNNLTIFAKTKKWLDQYFNHEKTDSSEIPIKLSGTKFSFFVWEILKTIPYGETITYGDIAKIISNKLGVNKMSSQAVGQAVGNNPISIIIPCHRVVGSNGKLIGYSASLDKKIFLLDHENKKNEKYT